MLVVGHGTVSNGDEFSPARSSTHTVHRYEFHVVPVLFGDGRRLFEHLGIGHRELERIRVLEGEGGVTHLHYRVRR